MNEQQLRSELKRIKEAYCWFTNEVRHALHGEWGFGKDHVQYVADIAKLRRDYERVCGERDRLYELVNRRERKRRPKKP